MTSERDHPTADRRVVRVYLGDHLAVMHGGAALAARMLDAPHHRDAAGLEDAVPQVVLGEDREQRRAGAAMPALVIFEQIASTFRDPDDDGECDEQGGDAAHGRGS